MRMPTFIPNLSHEENLEKWGKKLIWIVSFYGETHSNLLFNIAC